MSQSIEVQYLDHLESLIRSETRQDRTGTGTRSIFGHQLTHDMRDGFPLLTTKSVYWKGVLHELLWFLSGKTNIKYLNENGVHIWDEWADEDGELGPVYGEQWRRQAIIKDGKSVPLDQIQAAIDLIKKDPFSRRIIVDAWNPSVLPDPALEPKENPKLGRQALPPCHTFFQLYVSELGTDKTLSLHMYQRSADWFLGVPFNIASYAALLCILSDLLGMIPGKIIYSFGDTHLYENHVDAAVTQLKREPFPLPELIMSGFKRSIDEYCFEDIWLTNYQSHPSIKAPISV